MMLLHFLRHGHIATTCNKSLSASQFVTKQITDSYVNSFQDQIFWRQKRSTFHSNFDTKMFDDEHPPSTSIMALPSHSSIAGTMVHYDRLVLNFDGASRDNPRKFVVGGGGG